MRMRRPYRRSLNVKYLSALTERSHRKNNRWPQHVATDSEIAMANLLSDSKFSTTSRKKSRQKRSVGKKHIASTLLRS
jgi:hypothetical protein